MKYRAEIDGLRALAVLPVILFHAGFELFGGGFVGVDVFFVISGYLITTIIISEMAENRFSIINFYERRARRILPALFLVMAVCIPFSWFWLAPIDLKDFGQSLIAVSVFLSNFLFWLESGYFDTAAELKPLLHTWSLAVEEQYYIIFPIFMMLTWRFGSKWILLALFLIFLISLAAAQWGAFNNKSLAFFLLPTRGWELLLGVFIAFYLKKKTYINSFSVNQILSLLGFGMIIYSIFTFDKYTPFPSLYALIPTIGTGLLILCSVQKTIIHKILSLKPIVGIGLISYSAYLWHQPLLAFTRHRLLGEIPEILILFICFSSLIFAWISWRFIEKPFRDRNYFQRKHIFIFSSIGIIFFTSVGYVFHLNNGFPNRIDSKIDLSTIQQSSFRSKCHTEPNDSIDKIPCEYFGNKIEWATFGDSHVVELTYALAEELHNNNIGVQHNSFSGCEPAILNTSSDCYLWTNQTLNRLIKNKSIKNVVISYRLTVYMHGESLGFYPAFPNKYTLKDREQIWTNLLEIFNFLSSNGKKVFFVLQPPELPDNIYKMAFLNNNESDKIKGVTRSWWKQRNSFVLERINQIPKNIEVINIEDAFCDDLYCYGNNSDGYFYFDDDHVSIHGASLIVEEGMLLSRN
tara:strand:- start:52 stop:1950 length:1899 start_codon:yes stop_codon:yes gene_type:complete